MLKIYDEKNNIYICGFAKAGSQILQKVFNECLGYPIVHPNHSKNLNSKYWVLIRDHRSRVLSVFYEKQLSWHNVPNNNLLTWGKPCTYNNFMTTVFPRMISNHHLAPYTSTPACEINFDRVYETRDVVRLVEDYCSEFDINPTLPVKIASTKIFHKVPYVENERVNGLSCHPSQLDPTIIKQSALYFRHDIMNTEEINAKIRATYSADFEKFEQIKF